MCWVGTAPKRSTEFPSVSAAGQQTSLRARDRTDSTGEAHPDAEESGNLQSVTFDPSECTGVAGGWRSTIDIVK
jgi:hypothetical protein